MKKIIALAFIASLSPMSAFGKADFAITWVLSGVAGVTELSLDLDIGTNFIPAHGALRGANGLRLPITGTCLINDSTGKMNCTFFMGLGSMGFLNASLDTLGGEWTTVDSSGNATDEGVVTVSRVD